MLRTWTRKYSILYLDKWDINHTYFSIYTDKPRPYFPHYLVYCGREENGDFMFATTNSLDGVRDGDIPIITRMHPADAVKLQQNWGKRAKYSRRLFTHVKFKKGVVVLTKHDYWEKSVRLGRYDGF